MAAKLNFCNLSKRSLFANPVTYGNKTWPITLIHNAHKLLVNLIFRSESAGSSTYVVFMIYMPLVISLDPPSIKVNCTTSTSNHQSQSRSGVTGFTSVAIQVKPSTAV